MESLKELYKIGYGPSSSHTLAPMRACRLFKTRTPDAHAYTVELYGSLALTGKGHNTDQIIIDTLEPTPTDIKFYASWDYPYPHGLKLKALDEFNQVTFEWVVYSLGGGSIKVLDEDFDFQKQIYNEKSFNEVIDFCKEKDFTLADYVYYYEPEIKPYLNSILKNELFLYERLIHP